MTEQTKFKVGQVWKDTRGQFNIIRHISHVDMSVQGCNHSFDIFGHGTLTHNLDGSYTTLSNEYDLVCLVRDVVPENQTTKTDIQLKIQQIEQQPQELKALLKD